MIRKLSIALGLFFLLCSNALAQQNYYVSTYGADTSKGTIENPLATVQMALRKVREQRRIHPEASADYHIFLKGGTYALSEPIFIRPEDAGTSSSKTIISSFQEEKVVLSGGTKIDKWHKFNSFNKNLLASLRGKVWEADVSGLDLSAYGIRQLWINGKKATRAKDTHGELMNRIYSWNKKERTCLIPTGLMSKIKNVEGMEMFIHQWWAIANLRVKKMEVKGDTTKLFFKDPESRIQSEHPWPAPWISKETGNSAFYMVNAIELLDEPGEWYHDTKSNKIFYYPFADENMLKADVYAPVLESLVDINGVDEARVKHIRFENIQFSYCTWNRPSISGHVPHQIGMYMTDAYRLNPAGTSARPSLDNQAWVGRPNAAVQVNHAEQLEFKDCKFVHLGSTGLDIHKSSKNIFVEGNLFKDICGNGILAGIFSDPGSEIHLPYIPKDQSDVNSHVVIRNNLISDVTNEDWSCAGIAIGYMQHALVENNEIEEVSYTGISLGWGWNPSPNPNLNNKIINNYIHHYGKHNYDCAGIYTLGYQSNGLISGNRIDSIYKATYAHLPTHWFYLYSDEGTSNLTMENNWTPSEKFLQNANGPNNIWRNNGPAVNASIKANAGIDDAYKIKLHAYSYNRNEVKLSINEERDEVIELVVKEDAIFSLDSLRRFLTSYHMDADRIFSWKNHHVIYSKVKDIAVLQGKLQKNFPNTDVRVFHDMFYQYDRRDCGEKIVEQELTHVLLTANMVSDPKLQSEYLEAHATQRRLWPEVAQGFCNADFQRLQLFKNGRQLILVISIPKGKTLDDLNPKTTLNNPRMDAWNAKMKNYQEGIQGTKEGETWVFLTQENK